MLLLRERVDPIVPRDYSPDYDRSVLFAANNAVSALSYNGDTVVMDKNGGRFAILVLGKRELGNVERGYG